MEKLEQKKVEVMKIRAERRSGTWDTWEIGEANPESNLNDSVLFSHNYYRRENKSSDLAECQMCEAEQIKTFIRTSSTRGLIGHLRRKHFEYFAEFELKSFILSQTGLPQVQAFRKQNKIANSSRKWQKKKKAL